MVKCYDNVKLFDVLAYMGWLQSPRVKGGLLQWIKIVYSETFTKPIRIDDKSL